MKTSLLMCIVCFLAIACQKENNSDPEILEGNYITTPLLDFRCVALLPDQLPTLKVSRQTLNSFDISLNINFPDKRTVFLKGMSLEPTQDGFSLRYNNQPGGSWKNVSYLDNKKILNVSVTLSDEFVYFVGEKK